ncbi:MAG: beta-lactamase family protein [Actinobacteria bacterium]|nr:beta-lactamase family protein [Actinomycetota bacterium]
MKSKIFYLLIIVTLLVFLVLIGVSCKGVKVSEPSYWPTDGWQSATPESQGIDSNKLIEGLNAINNNGTHIHSLMIVRNDFIILDSYFYPYDGSNYHDIASVTKSIMTTLIGIAADQGKLDIDRPMLSFFPDRTIANRDSMKEQITVRHLVSNSSGFLFNEKDDRATIQSMVENDDWIQATLDLPVVHKPGTHFGYFSPGMHLLSAILQEATGMTALEFADVNLFKPLGIDINNVFWPSDPQGYNYGWGDLSLYPEDMAKIGFLFLYQGKWEGKQIVSSKWVNEATKKQLATEPYRGEDYGFGWWISRPNADISYYLADGRGGQRIIVIPSMNLLLVTTGGGFSFDEIDPYIIAIIADLENPKDPNPSGIEKLNAIVAELKQPPEPQPVSPLPEIAGIISGKTFVFEENKLNIKSFNIDFDNKKEAMLQLDGEEGQITAVIGLDGLWRSSISGYPVLMRGSWEDANTFIIEYNGGPDLNYSKLKFIFENNKVKVKVLIPVTYEGLTVEGKIK